MVVNIMDLKEYIEIQKNEFHDFYNDKNKTIVIAVKDKEGLESLYKTKYIDGFLIEEYIDTNAILVSHDNGKYELFIKGTYNQYRKRFQTFLIEKYNLDQSFKLESIINVDHLMNKKRIKDYFIRMILLPDKVNQDWGRSYENVVTQLERQKSKKSAYLLDYSIFLKAIEFSSIKKKDITADDDSVSLKAQQIIAEIEKSFGEIGPLKSYLESYYRAEINYIVRGRFYDHKADKNEISSLSDLENKESLINVMKHIIEDGVIDFGEGHYYIYRKKANCAATQIINNCLNENINTVTVKLFERSDVYSLIKIKIEYTGKNTQKLIEEMYTIDIEKCLF